MASRVGIVGVATAAAVTGLFVSVASGNSSARVHLWQIPLPKSSLGSAARRLTLAADSGSSLEADAEHGFYGVPDAIGRVGGYSLDYGNEGSGKAGVDAVWTSVEEYANAKSAAQCLEAWRTTDHALSGLNYNGLSVTNAPVDVPPVGSARYADLTSYRASNIAPVSTVDEGFTDGSYLLHVTVAARTAAQAEKLESRLVTKLDARLEAALEGRLQAKPVKLPAKPVPRSTAGAPDLSAMGLAPSDLSGNATLVFSAYFNPEYTFYAFQHGDYLALSHCLVRMNPAGPFRALTQEIEWFPTANEASFFTDRLLAYEGKVGFGPAHSLSNVGDAARALFGERGPGVSAALVVFSTGRLAEALEVDNYAPVSVSDVTHVAQTAANKINAAIGA